MLIPKINSEKERILIYIIKHLISSHSTFKNMNCYDEMQKKHLQKKIKIGDLVLCQTSGIHNWTIGYVHEVKSESNMIIREIGGSCLSNIENEMFYLIDGMNPIQLLEGEQYKFYLKIRKAISKINNYMRPLKNIYFNENNVTISIRERFKNEDDLHFITFQWTKKMSIKLIVDKLLENGFLTHEFTKPTPKINPGIIPKNLDNDPDPLNYKNN